MPLIRLALSAAVAFSAAIAFLPALRHRRRWRVPVYLACSAAVALSPCLVTTDATPLRFAASLVAISLLVKFYDLRAGPGDGRLLGLRPYLAYLPNWFWLVRRREPRRPPMDHDLRRLMALAPAAILSVVPCVLLFRADWSSVPFAVEHVLKVPAVVAAVALWANAAAAGYRLLGGVALDPMGHLVCSPTPAEFWRRWNRPAQHFLREYAFVPAGGLRRPVRATLVTFGVSGLVHEYVLGIASGRVQGRQLLFFLLQGGAVAATLRVRPRGLMTSLWVAGTWAFMLASSVLFFASVDDVLPFYWPRDR